MKNNKRKNFRIIVEDIEEEEEGVFIGEEFKEGIGDIIKEIINQDKIIKVSIIIPIRLKNKISNQNIKNRIRTTIKIR